MDYVTQNTFSRSIANDACMGFYETDDGHMRSIASFYEFEGCATVLEPSAGTGRAVRTLLSGTDHEKVKLFMVELDKERAAGLKAAAESGELPSEAVLQADFLCGTKISNGVFSFCFANPPYGTDPFTKERYEKRFLDRISTLLKAGGKLCYVIPSYVLADDKFNRLLLYRFTVDAVYRFRDPVYNQFKQTVVFATKKQHSGFSVEDKEALLKKLGEISVLPLVYEGTKIVIPEGKTSEIRQFSRTVFDPVAGYEAIRRSKTPSLLASKIFKPPYQGNKIRDPLIPLSADMSKLLAICGAGQGFGGRLEDGTLHLQRGCVKRAVSTQQDGSGKVITERSFASVGLTIIEQSGKITEL